MHNHDLRYGKLAFKVSVYNDLLIWMFNKSLPVCLNGRRGGPMNCLLRVIFLNLATWL